MEQGTTQIFLLGSLPGQILLNPQRIYPGRVVGIWYRMPGDVSHLPTCNLFRCLMNFTGFYRT